MDFFFPKTHSSQQNDHNENERFIAFVLCSFSLLPFLSFSMNFFFIARDETSFILTLQMFVLHNTFGWKTKEEKHEVYCGVRSLEDGLFCLHSFLLAETLLLLQIYIVNETKRPNERQSIRQWHHRIDLGYFELNASTI